MCIRDRIDALRNAAGRATFANIAAGSSALVPAAPLAGTFEHRQAAREARADGGAAPAQLRQ
eukprot:5525146-Alexandrium_andersonii.AAC.1